MSLIEVHVNLHGRDSKHHQAEKPQSTLPTIIEPSLKHRGELYREHNTQNRYSDLFPSMNLERKFPKISRRTLLAGVAGLIGLGTTVAASAPYIFDAVEAGDKIIDEARKRVK